MRIFEAQEKILELKKKKDICILAHSYQAREITEIADYTGDSYGLSLQASKTSQNIVAMCGVRFMAETVKLLSPEKTVYLVNPIAGCPMAEQIDPEEIIAFKKDNPGYTVVAYINTTARLKAVSDVCVTSSSAIEIVRQLGNDILFIPDRNLGDYVSKNFPEKNIKLMHGGCPVHDKITATDAQKAKDNHPGALLLAHPECLPEVLKKADFVGSTSAIMDFAKKSKEKEFIIGTEISIVEHLQYDCPGKRFYPLSQNLVCPDMKVTTLTDLYNVLAGEGGEEITIPSELASEARKCIDEMIRLGG